MLEPLARGLAVLMHSVRSAAWLGIFLVLSTLSRLGFCNEVAAGAQTPGDAPRVSSDNPNIPVLPPGFHTHDAGWIRFYYPPEARPRIQKLIDSADAARAQLSDRLGRFVLHDVHVRIGRTAREMQALAPEGIPYPKYASGVAYPELNLVLLTLTPQSPNERLDVFETFQHELAHIGLAQAVNGQSIPRWFNEGFAVFASGESSFPRLQTLWTATLAGSLMPLDRLERSFPEDAVTASVAYAEAADVVRYLARKEDHHRFNGLIERLAQGNTFEKALVGAYGLDRFALEYEWREDVGRRYTFWPVLFSTTVVWGGIVGLFFWGYRRKKVSDRATLERWKREEALEDAQQQALSHQAAALSSSARERVHIVVGNPTQRLAAIARSQPGVERDIPRVEHDGHWHTLH
jgi:hypothetical protein